MVVFPSMRTTPDMGCGVVTAFKMRRLTGGHTMV
jgi:hypothetical protein